MSVFLEYQRAWEVREVDKQRDFALQAWTNQAPKATQGKGKNTRPKYRKMDDFFNYKESLLSVLDKNYKPKNNLRDLADINSLMNEYLEKERR